MANDKTRSENVQTGEVSEEVAISRLFNEEQLSGITSFQDAADALNSATTVDNFDDYGNGFDVLDTDDKTQLLKMPFVIIEWRFTQGKQGEFVSATIVTKDNRKLILNDGSTGILSQLQMVTRKRTDAGHANPQAGLMVPKGLRVSEYTYVDRTTGNKSDAKTFYLAN